MAPLVVLPQGVTGGGEEDQLQDHESKIARLEPLSALRRNAPQAIAEAMAMFA